MRNQVFLNFPGSYIDHECFDEETMSTGKICCEAVNGFARELDFNPFDRHLLKWVDLSWRAFRRY